MSELPPIDSPITLEDWHFPWPAGEVNWEAVALLVIDMQNYGCNPDVGLGPMLSERHPRTADYYLPRLTETVIPNVTRLIAAFRLANREVIFTRHGPFLADGRDMIERRRRRDVDALAATSVPALWHRGTFEHELIEQLQPLPDELVVDKNTSSAFNSTGIEWLLWNMGVETLVVVGMATDMCVETTARDAADRGFHVIVVEDGTATFFERHHRAALSGFARVFGQVWPTDDVIAALPSRAERA
ncbi:MAG: isochorismatase family cysteine hydrolase [Thermoleophilia bacterium]